jgi:hypothetical protein
METNVKTQGKNGKTASIKLQKIDFDTGSKLRVKKMQCSTRWGRNDFFSMHSTRVKSGGENGQHQVQIIIIFPHRKIQAGK